MEPEDLLEFFKNVGKLKRMPRMGWLIVGIPTQIVESVAEHVMRTTIISISFCQQLKKENLSLDCGKVAQIAIAHDLSEATFMDVGGVAREIIGREKRVEYEKKGIQLLLKNLDEDLRNYYLGLWGEYEKKTSLEALIVYLADKLEMFLQAQEYFEIGVNRELLKEFYSDLKKIFEIIEENEVLEPLRKYFEKFTEFYLESE